MVLRGKDELLLVMGVVVECNGRLRGWRVWSEKKGTPSDPNSFIAPVPRSSGLSTVPPATTEPLFRL